MLISEITVGLAFIAGLASFLSPCVFALVPAYVGYLSGRSLAGSGDNGRNNSWITFTHGIAFVLGFSIVFIALGVLASFLGGVLADLNEILVRIGGIVVVIFGLHMTHIIRIPFLEYDLRPQSRSDRNRGYLSSVLMGVFFSAGWSPCVGPILGTVLTLAYSGSDVTQGAVLLTAYSAGLAIPFLIAATQIGWVTTIIRRYGKVMYYAEIVMGVILIGIGVLLFLGRFEQMAGLAPFFEFGDEMVIGRYLLIGILAAVILGLIPAYIAYRKGRPFVDWWFFGAGLFPIALLVSLLIKKDVNGLQDRQESSTA